MRIARLERELQEIKAGAEPRNASETTKTRTLGEGSLRVILPFSHVCSCGLGESFSDRTGCWKCGAVWTGVPTPSKGPAKSPPLLGRSWHSGGEPSKKGWVPRVRARSAHLVFTMRRRNVGRLPARARALALLIPPAQQPHH